MDIFTCSHCGFAIITEDEDDERGARLLAEHHQREHGDCDARRRKEASVSAQVERSRPPFAKSLLN